MPVDWTRLYVILFRYMSRHTFLTNLDSRLNWTFLFVSCITIEMFEIMICLMFFQRNYKNCRTKRYPETKIFILCWKILPTLPFEYVTLTWVHYGDPNFLIFEISKSWFYHFKIYIHESQNWFQISFKSKIEKLLAVLRFAS